MEAQLIQILPEDRQLEPVEQNFEGQENVEHLVFREHDFLFVGNLRGQNVERQNIVIMVLHQRSA